MAEDHYFITKQVEPDMATGGTKTTWTLYYGQHRLNRLKQKRPVLGAKLCDRGVGPLEFDRIKRVKEMMEGRGLVPSETNTVADGAKIKMDTTREDGQMMLDQWARRTRQPQDE